MKGNCVSRSQTPHACLTRPSRVHDHLAAIARVVRVGFRSLRVLKVNTLLRVGYFVVNV